MKHQSHSSFMKALYLKSTILLFYTTSLLGQIKKQPNIQFETDYIDAVNHWVVLPQKSAQISFLVGYIFLDEIVGFTFDFYGILAVDSSQQWVLENNSPYYMVKRMLDSRTPRVHLLSDNKIAHLKLPERPFWLQLQDQGNETATRLVLYGYHYNKVNRSQVALPLLEKAFLIDPATKNLLFELAFAYNAMGYYEKAIALLEKELPKEKNNYLLYRELGYALLQLNRFDEAETLYEDGLKICENAIQKREMIIDMTQTFYDLKDEVKFEKWAKFLKN